MMTDPMMDVDSGAPAPTGTPQTGLHQMPNEILLIILQSLRTPYDLDCLLEAFPQYRVIFDRHSDLVLAAVLRNAIRPEALHHALAVLYAPPMTRTVELDHFEAFAKRYLEDDVEFAFPTEPEDVARLHKIYRNVSAVIDAYAGHALSLLTCSGSHLDHRAVLSDDECARFQRAFFRYDVYCRVFPTISIMNYHEEIGYHTFNDEYQCPGSQYDLFISALQRWEVEELSCVDDFYLSWVTAEYEAIEVKFIDEARPMLQDFETWSARQSGGNDHVPGSATLARFHQETVSAAELQKLDLLLVPRDTRYAMRRRCRFVASLGADMMAALVQCPDADVTRGLLRHIPPLCVSLADAIRIQDGRELQQPLNRVLEVIPEDIYNAGAGHLGPGYYLFRGRCGRSKYLPAGLGSERDRMRQRAYAFWDDARIREPQVTRGFLAAQEMPAPTLRPNSESPLDALPRDAEYRIRRDDLKRLKAKYGGPRESPEGEGGPADAFRKAEVYQHHVHNVLLPGMKGGDFNKAELERALVRNLMSC